VQKSSKMLSVAVQGGTLAVDVSGLVSDDWPVLLCLHGWTLDKQSFAAQRGILEHNITVVSFDRRGFGNNRLPPDFALETADLRAVISAIGRPVILYGVSQGARLALRFALEDSAGISGLVLQGGHVDGLQVTEAAGEAIPFDRYRQWLAAGELQLFRADWLAHPLMRRGCESVAPEVMAKLVEAYRGADLLTENALPKPMDMDGDLQALDLPMLVLKGEYEVSSRCQHAEVLAALPNAQSVVIDGGGHLCNLSHPEAVNRAIVNWLVNLPAS